MEIFGKRIRELRKENGLKQQDIANILGTTKQNVSRWEIDFCEPDQATMVKLARFFGVSADYLLGLENYDGSKKD